MQGKYPMDPYISGKDILVYRWARGVKRLQLHMGNMGSFGTAGAGLLVGGAC